ncbi:MAG: FHA domain-containing protein [Actinomycetota bacterium]|nr:FHA domain-containing protein [Actinomycetota bacterium]
MAEQSDRLSPRPRTARELSERLVAERAGVPFLLYRDEEDCQRIFALEADRSRLTLGRDRANDIALWWDPEVSRAHAELERVAGEWAVADDGLSRNGTFVNGRVVHGRRRLAGGDSLRLGGTVLLFSGSIEGTQGMTVAARETPVPDELTPTQRRILAALCQPLVRAGGMTAPASNKEIADAVHLSIEGVKSQLRTLFDRFAVADLPQNRKRLELAERALRAGLGAPASTSDP